MDEDEVEVDAFPRGELKKLPYVVLVDPGSGRGAAYSAQHRLLVEEASAALLRFARERHVHAAAWQDELDVHWHRERAAWMPVGSLQGWQLYWLRNDGSRPEHLRAIPKR
jgi:hypothetical protein